MKGNGNGISYCSNYCFSSFNRTFQGLNFETIQGVNKKGTPFVIRGSVQN